MKLPRKIGMKKVVHSCGYEMERMGGQFGEVCVDTYICKKCEDAVNIIWLPENNVKELFESLKEQGRI